MSNRQSHYMSSNMIDHGFSSLSKRPRMAGTMPEVVKINELARARGMSYGQFVSEGRQLLSKIKFPEWVKAVHNEH